MADESPTRRAYEVALQTRSFEIELFWKRALFFWAFVAAAFAAFGSVYLKDPGMALVVAGFGTVCSFAWTLANRGSKYWQQTWEGRVAELEAAVTGSLFDVNAPVQQDAPAWLRARRFSVSKLTIALSDFIAALWFILAVGQLLRVLGFEPMLVSYSRLGASTFFGLVCFYMIAIIIWCRTSPRGARDARSSTAPAMDVSSPKD